MLLVNETLHFQMYAKKSAMFCWKKVKVCTVQKLLTFYTPDIRMSGYVDFVNLSIRLSIHPSAHLFVNFSSKFCIKPLVIALISVTAS